jgi:hypothetical protein
MLRKSLRRSFCRRRDAEVEKLVAGPRVYICDRCVAIAADLMNTPVDPDSQRQAPPTTLRSRLTGWRRRFGLHRTAAPLAEARTW